MPVRNTSKAALFSLTEMKKISPCQKIAMSYIYMNPGCTRNQIEHYTNLRINSVCGRVIELINKHKFVFENGCTKDAVSGESVNRLYPSVDGIEWCKANIERVAA